MPTYLCHSFRWHRSAIRVWVILRDLGVVAPDWILGRQSSHALLSQLCAEYSFIPQRHEDQEAGSGSGSEGPVLDSPLYPLGTKLSADTSGSLSKTVRREEDFSLPPSRVPANDDAVLWPAEVTALRLLEEYDPEDTEVPSRPYAYVADYAVRIALGADVVAEMKRYEEMAKKLEDHEKGGWLGRLRDELQKGEEVKWYVVVCGDDERDCGEEDDGEEEDEEEDTEGEGESVAEERLARLRLNR